LPEDFDQDKEKEQDENEEDEEEEEGMEGNEKSKKSGEAERGVEEASAGASVEDYIASLSAIQSGEL